MKLIFQRFALFLTLFGLVILTGCAGIAKVNPQRTGMMVTSSVSPGADGVTTTKTDYCTFRNQVDLEKAKAYEKDPALLVQDNACKEFGQLALHGSPSLGGELMKIGTGAAATGSVNYLMQSALQRKQGKICKDGGCVTTVNNNLNVNNNRNNANAQGGAAVSNSEAGAAAVSEVRIETPCTSGSCK